MDVKVLASAVEAGATLLSIGGKLYAAYPFDDLGWWVSEVEPGSLDYFVDFKLRCTCPAWGESSGCKHSRAVSSSILGQG